MTTSIADCTVPEKILLAASSLEEAGQSPFSAEALIVAAWQQHPNTFGLKGFADQYPDSNKVLTSIMGEKGLARKGWLSKVDKKLYSLTRDGKIAVRRMLAGEDAPPPPHPPRSASGLPKEQEKHLQTLLASTAWQKMRESRKAELTFADACRFWGITDNMTGEQLDERLEGLRTDLTSLEVRVGSKGIVLSDGRSVSADEIGKLMDTHVFLEGRFGRHLTLLRNRSGRP